ncbi:DUF2922 domain-containing protein [Candidatus Enterococcus murrayae]|uniref:DUF2922 domain-containing protein n=1 Tax=Candidatus Enterococcus murrayae TaxID=2815321 RepID=A0ABS3HLD2_9ENTE|nr:DUF2922 domain-containing protein [Enterococcus sp. MJM16]MBO0453720.1 DUF2922 domain-containing protein [Enterococcus sp. MJM16]
MKIITTKKLVSTFKKSDGKKQHLTIKDPAVDKSAAEVREALELLTTLDIFEEENGVKPFAEVDTCKYVETIKYIQFDKDNPVEAVEPTTLSKPIKVPAPVTRPKPNYEKFVDLVCPAALENLSDIHFTVEKEAAEATPEPVVLQNIDRLDSNAPTMRQPIETSPAAAPEVPPIFEKPKRKKRLIHKMKELLLGGFP